MGKLIDLTGKKFGMLTVIERTDSVKKGRPMWLCQCECGNITSISSSALIHHGTQSCGCLRHRQSPTLIDLTGQKFEKLTVIRKDAPSKGGKSKWICLCECGKTTSVSSDRLRNGKAKSCGCSKRKIKHDLTGQEFGYLLVIERVINENIKSNETRWKCLCRNCGRTVEVSSYWLRNSDPYGHCNCTRFNKP